MRLFSREQFLILKGLEGLDEPVEIPALAGTLQVDQALVAAGAQLLANQGLVEIEESPFEEIVLKEGGEAAVQGKLPERRVLEALSVAGRGLTMQELPERSGLETRQVGASLKLLTAKGWAIKKGPELVLGEKAGEGLAGAGPDEALLEALSRRPGQRAGTPDLAAEGLDVAAALELLKGRRELIEVKQKRRRYVRLSPAGGETVAEGIEEAREVAQLTPELIATGEWREVTYKNYDIDLGVSAIAPGKPHPMQRVLDTTRRIFVEMGFEEVRTPWVESAFWNFDALFQPQDHPAREMQDTFYLKRPSEVPLPDDTGLVERVAATHEDGGATGSQGWQYRWDPKRAMTAVLRTHNTAASARSVAANPASPRKVFCMGRVFRREAIDYKHLPVFQQVDGIIIDQQASFAHLLGTLGAFYTKMGFEKFEFRPGFFPYTEPSVEVFIWLPEKQDWFEMGGAGIFRPEVTEPLGCTSPVLAWGLGLERLAMLQYNILDMRSLYLTDLEWLKEVPVCR